MNQYVQSKETEFERIYEFFQKEIASIRTGRANPSILDNVRIEAYGTKSPINALANVNIADAQCIIIAPWDKTIVKEIEKGIIEANLSLSVTNEGDQIRLKAAPLTEENRKELVRNLNDKYEKSRIDLRQVRDSIKSQIEKAFSDKEIAEDDKFRFVKELDEEVGKQNDKLKQTRDVKEKDIMTI
ncbi:MAG: ribosome-recycling factor [bacterium]